MVEDDECLETPKQLAARKNLSEGKIRHLVQSGQLEQVMIGSRVHIPSGAWGRFIKREIESCHAEIRDQNSAGSASANAFTSLGPSEAAAASAALARQTANKLKSSSRNFSSSDNGEAARVIPIKS